MKKTAVDLCCDTGESCGAYALGSDEALLSLISSANVACGFHAGDPHIMRKTIRLAKRHGVRVGAHPSLADRSGFGRRAMQISPSELQDILIYQIGALRALVEAEGMKLQHVLQHGALTRMAEDNEEFGKALLESILEVDSSMFYPAFEGSYLPEMARRMGLKVIMVAFADRAYERNKRLVRRDHPGAVIHELDAIEKRIEQLVMCGEVTTIDGHNVQLEFDSILLHGDTPDAVLVARTVSKTLRMFEVAIRPMSALYSDVSQQS